MKKVVLYFCAIMNFILTWPIKLYRHIKQDDNYFDDNDSFDDIDFINEEK